jgi:hypothetical protein
MHRLESYDAAVLSQIGDLPFSGDDSTELAPGSSGFSEERIILYLKNLRPIRLTEAL